MKGSQKGVWAVKQFLFSLLMLFALVSGPTITAAPNGCTNDPHLISMGNEQITVSSTAIGFTSTKVAPAGQDPAVYVAITVETNAVRYLDSGATPTAAVGDPLPANFKGGVCGTVNIKRALFIRQTADATVDAIFYRRGDQ